MSRQRGSVLVLVLVMIVLLEGILVEFYGKVRVRAHIAENIVTSDQALFAAEACLAVASRTLETVRDLDSRRVRGLLSRGALPVGDHRCELVVTRETGRINLNALVDDDGDVDDRQLEIVLALIDRLNRVPGRVDRASYSFVASVIDWIDDDDLVTQLSQIGGDNRGAERNYYLSLTPAYSCKNAPLDTIDELRLIRGASPAILDGSLEAPGLLRYVSVLGSGIIDINEAPPIVLECLSPNMTPRVVDAIVERRARRRFRNLDEVRDLSGMTEELYDQIESVVTVENPLDYYRITATGHAGRVSRSILAIVSRESRTGRTQPIARWER